MSWFSRLFSSSEKYDKSGKPSSTLIGHTEPKKELTKTQSKTTFQNEVLPPKKMDDFSSRNPDCRTIAANCNHVWNYNWSPAQCTKCGKMAYR